MLRSCGEPVARPRLMTVERPALVGKESGVPATREQPPAVETPVARPVAARRWSRWLWLGLAILLVAVVAVAIIWAVATEDETIIAAELKNILANNSHKDARSEFQVWSQAKFNTTPKYTVVHMAGPDHEREFTVEVTVNEEIWGKGVGRSKQNAAHAAAREAMKRVDQLAE